MIEDRLVGIKSREIYECPAALTIVQAHRELETLTLTKDVLRFKSAVEQRYAELTYDGLWFTPLKSALDAFIEETQKTVTGTVRLKLYKGSCHRSRPHRPPRPLQQRPRHLRPQQHLRRSLGRRLHRPLGPSCSSVGRRERRHRKYPVPHLTCA